MKQLIITGDDFGLNSRVNEEVERLHQAGLLTQASLMVNESAASEAARIARRNPNLLVGLHLTLCDGRATRPSAITGIHGRLAGSPAITGIRYAFSPRLRGPLELEITGQIEAFRALGFSPVYWDGHAHLHLHPRVFDLALPLMKDAGFRVVRLVREKSMRPLALVFRALSRRAAVRARQQGTAFADRTIGLTQSGRITTGCMVRRIARLRAGITEFYLHPGAEPAPLQARPILAALAACNVGLINARELI